MLVKILNLLAIGGVVTIEEIASETGASEALVLDMLTNLTQRGYLRLLDIACQSGCSACPMANTCAVRGTNKTWALTQKGARLIANGNRLGIV